MRCGAIPEIEAAGRRVVDAGLGHGRSVIEPAVAAWAPGVAADLRHRIIDNADTGTGSLLGKLQARLEGAPRATCLLAAELFYVHVVPLGNMNPEPKQTRIRSVLGWMQPPAALPADLDAALAVTGVFNGGVGFNVEIWRQVGWLLSFVEHWWSRPEPDRRSALEDAWVFRTVVSAMPADQPGIRNALLYLAVPRTFFPIVNQDHKRAIRNAFAAVTGGPTGTDAVTVDRDLLAIRSQQRASVGDGL